MSYVVGIIRIADGATRTVEMPGEWDEGADYLWTEGNYACDCNRGLFFDRAIEPEATTDHACGNTSYRARLPDGRIDP